MQAVLNEDTDGDRAALKREIKRLNEELAAAKRQLAAGPPQQYNSGGFACLGLCQGSRRAARRRGCMRRRTRCCLPLHPTWR